MGRLKIYPFLIERITMLEKYKHLIATCSGVIGSYVANALGDGTRQ